MTNIAYMTDIIFKLFVPIKIIQKDNFEAERIEIIILG